MSAWIKSIAVAAFAVLSPIHSVMGAVGALIVIDLVMGMWASHKRKEKLTSAALRRTVSKIIAYQVAIISGFLLQKYLLEDALPIVKLVASAIGLVEIKSILENADEINGGSIFKALVKQIGSQNDKDEPKK